MNQLLWLHRKLSIYLRKYDKIMKEKLISTKIIVCDYNELSAEDKKLIDLAKEATQRSYAPYSKFHVGAALLLSNGEIVEGSNQENAAFPSSLCAERTAIYYAHAKYPGAKVETIAIAAFQNGDFISSPISPCGACRQSIMEYEKLAEKPIKILLYGKDEIYKISGIKALLPLQFEDF